MTTKLKPVPAMVAYDFIDMTREVEKVLGFDQRSAHTHYHKKGEYLDQSYMDFYHWQLDHTLSHDFCNDSYSTIYVGMDLDVYIEADKIEPWHVEIQQVWNDLYKDIADEGGHVNIWVSW